MNKAFYALLLVLMSPLMGLAQEQISSDFDAVIISPIEATSDVPMDKDVFTVTVDPSELKDAPKVDVDLATLEKLAHEMESPEYQKQLEEKVQIPTSTTSPEGLAVAESLTPEELTRFVSEKNHFLGKIAKTMSFLRLGPKSINKIVTLVNTQFFKNAGAYIAATHGTDGVKVRPIIFAFAGGVGFNDWIMAQLRKSPYLKNLPERSGFYYLLGAGVAIVSKVGPDGKTRFSIEPIIEFRRSTKIFSPFLFGAAGFQGGFQWQNRRTNDSVQIAKFYKASFVNVTNGGQSLGFNVAAAAVFPPGGGAVAGMEGDAYTIRLTPAIFKNFWNTVSQIILRRGGMKCSQIFQ